MKYQEVRRLRGLDGVVLRLKIWLRSALQPRKPVITDLSYLSDHIRCDIGLSEEVRYTDGKALRANGWR